jgi:predicted protein tyrosine phosphatase
MPCLTAVAYDRGDPVLVYSDRGVSRSAAVIVAFVSFQMRMNSQVSIDKMIQQIICNFLFDCLASSEIC